MRRWIPALTAFAALFLVGAVATAQQSKPDFGPPLGPPPNPLATAIDEDGDGDLSAEEMAAAAEALKKLDRNRDGTLSREEMRPRFRPGGGPPRGPRPGRGGESLEKPQVAKGDAEKKALQAIAQIAEKQGRMQNVPDTDGRMLRLLAEAIGARKVVEIGTSNGISAIWMCQGLRKTGGKLITLEIDPERAALAQKNLKLAGVDDLVTVVLGDAHEKVKELEGPIDMIFLDADKQGYIDYLEKLLPKLRPGGLVTAHNMNRRMADPRFLKAITEDPNLETLFYMQGGGLGITLKKR